ncbi:MAG: HAMP domain-containing histidine kinase [Deltaproteobacteria bacterium]|nr:HAMP domain-containing histidine kinase [Deltaproteobacteria bacterium]
MRLSLITRMLAAYLLVLALLGGVAVYCIVAMTRMQEEVTIVKQGLLPISSQLNRLARDLSHASALLGKGECEDRLWLRSFLPELRPFDVLSSVRDGLLHLGDQEPLAVRSRELFSGVAAEITRLLDGEGEDPELVRRERYHELVAGWLDAEAAGGIGPGATEESASGGGNATARLAGAVELLRRLVRSYEATCNLAIHSAWSDSRARELGTVRTALYLGLGALILTLLIPVLLFVWLRPLSQLRTYARRIAAGDYGPSPSLEGGDEVGQLAQELGVMAQRLKEREEKIRKQAGELLRADRFSTIGKMSTQIAHEIRNPLNALGLKLELLEDSIDDVSDDLGEETRETLQDAIRSSGKEIDRLREITDYYLKFAKFPKVEKEAVDLQTVLCDVVALYEQEAHSRGIVVEHEVEGPLRAHADSNLLRHAVANLLKNAMEATAGMPGEGRVLLKAFREGQRVRILVKDNGPGIPPEQLGSVFDPFFSTKESGTGLGLTLVQQVVQEHGGTVVCSSEAGEGTVFRISLPE